MQHRRFPILRDGAHRLALLAAPDEQEEERDEGRGDTQDHQPLARDDDGVEKPDGTVHRAVEALVALAEREQRAAFDEEEQSERDDHARQVLAAQRPQEYAVEDHAEHTHRNGGDEERGEVVNAQLGRQIEHAECAQHVEMAVGELDQAQNLARLDGEVDSAERRKATEVLSDSRKFEECHGLHVGACGTPCWPRYTRLTSSFWASASVAPVITTCPVSRT